MRDTSFTALAVHALRRHRWCGDTFSWNGWPEVNTALAVYALDRRRNRSRMRFQVLDNQTGHECDIEAQAEIARQVKADVKSAMQKGELLRVLAADQI
jgi:hypothetical protein